MFKGEIFQFSSLCLKHFYGPSLNFAKIKSQCMQAKVGFYSWKTDYNLVSNRQGASEARPSYWQHAGGLLSGWRYCSFLVFLVVTGWDLLVADLKAFGQSWHSGCVSWSGFMKDRAAVLGYSQKFLVSCPPLWDSRQKMVFKSWRETDYYQDAIKQSWHLRVEAVAIG